jgi:hypothetical protein
VKNQKKISSFNINVNKDDTVINDFLTTWQSFDSRPNRLTIFNSYSSVKFNDVVMSLAKEKTIHTEIIPAENESVINDQIFVETTDGVFISYIVLDRNNDNSTVNEITFFYKTEDDYSKVIDIVGKLDGCVVSYESTDDCYKLNTVSFNNGAFEIEPVDLQDLDFDSLELYYPSKTFSKVEKLCKSIKKSSKGLSILYGDRGTGKTSLINYLSTKLDRIVIFIPNNLIEHTINNPEFRKFLKKHYKPILIIDDCEMLFNELFTKSNPFVNNLLQLVDGFLSDSIEVNVVTIFNVEDEDEIDHTLLDCNNLIDMIECNYLSSEESTELSKHMGWSKKYKSKTRLVDVVKKRETKDFGQIGF